MSLICCQGMVTATTSNMVKGAWPWSRSSIALTHLLDGQGRFGSGDPSQQHQAQQANKLILGFGFGIGRLGEHRTSHER